MIRYALGGGEGDEVSAVTIGRAKGEEEDGKRREREEKVGCLEKRGRKDVNVV